MELTKTLQILHALADGVNPQTGEVFPENSPYQHPETIRALFVALSVLDAYRDGSASAERSGLHRARAAVDEDIKLTPQQELVYEQLRQWRSHKAHEEGIASFMILHNSQIKRMVTLPVTSMAELLTIKGFGEKRTKKYGAEILAVVAQA